MRFCGSPERAGAVGLALLTLCACEPTEPWPSTTRGPVTGAFQTPGGVGGDAWLFLFRPGEGPPGTPTTPRFATAVSAARLERDPRFVFPEVPAGSYRAWGFLDVDSDFDPEVDVLAQPGAGDRVGVGVEVEVQPGRGARFDYRADALVPFEPPAFRLEGVGDDVRLDDLPSSLTPLTLVAEPLERFDPARLGFPLGLVDADGDGRPDDADGDGVPDLSLQLFLRWLPLPGQLPEGVDVIVPLAFDPTPALRQLDGTLGLTVVMSRLQTWVLPLAERVTTGADGQQQLEPLDAPPPGAWEVVALAGSGQYWRLPNALGDRWPSQRTRLRFDRGGR